MLLIFGLSILLRVPNLNRPLSKHHEFCTAIWLRPLTIWHENGIDAKHFLPIMTYNGESNKHINNHANTSGKMIDEDGNYYYVSHPPFAYYFPYFLFTITGQAPSVLGLQIINLACHFLSAIFIYFIVCLLGINRARGRLFKPALVAFIIYVFNPASLWFQANVYMSDILVHTIFVIGIYITLKMFMRRRFISPKYFLSFFISCFLMVYTSWLAWFFIACVIFYALWKLRHVRGYAIVILLATSAFLLGNSLWFYQYSQINGADALLTELATRFSIRSSFASSSSIINTVYSKMFAFGHLGINYLTAYIPLFALLMGFVMLFFSRSKMRILFTKNGYRFLWLAFMPVLLLHAFLLNYSGHDFTVLYASAGLSVLIGVLYDKLRYSNAIKAGNQHLILLLAIGFMMLQYYYINRPGEVSFNGDTYATHKNLAAQLNELPKEAVLFSLNYTPSPQFVYYLGRNIKGVSSLEEAQTFLDEHYKDVDGFLISGFEEATLEASLINRF